MANLQMLRWWLETQERCNHGVNVIDWLVAENPDATIKDAWDDLYHGYGFSVVNILDAIEIAAGYRGKYSISDALHKALLEFGAQKRRFAREIGEDWQKGENYTHWLNLVKPIWKETKERLWQEHHERFEEFLERAYMNTKIG
jgi:hypothetical protein